MIVQWLPVPMTVQCVGLAVPRRVRTLLLAAGGVQQPATKGYSHCWTKRITARRQNRSTHRTDDHIWLWCMYLVWVVVCLLLGHRPSRITNRASYIYTSCDSPKTLSPCHRHTIYAERLTWLQVSTTSMSCRVDEGAPWLLHSALRLASTASGRCIKVPTSYQSQPWSREALLADFRCLEVGVLSIAKCAQGSASLFPTRSNKACNEERQTPEGIKPSSNLASARTFFCSPV